MNVLMKVKADESVAVFGIVRESSIPQDANDAMNSTVQRFLASLKTLNIRQSAIYVGYITEPRIYEYTITGNISRESSLDSSLKKEHLDPLHRSCPARQAPCRAASAEIYDLIKVDYVVGDISVVQSRLMTEAAAVITQKLARDEKLLGVKVKSTPALYAKHPSMYYPSRLYDSYTAGEAEAITRPSNIERFAVQQARKNRTFFFNGLDGNGFDKLMIRWSLSRWSSSRFISS